MLKLLKKLDFLSPKITLYHKGELSHSSWMSGILSLIQIFIIILCGIYYSLDLIFRREPRSFFYYRFIDNAGFHPVNSSSLFHFISISTNEDIALDYDFDFFGFRVIGIDSYYVNYLDNPNLTVIDHWIYGKCNISTDTKGIGYLINTKDFKRFENFACIKKFYDSKIGKYYQIGDDYFRWPNISFGLANPKGTFYSILIDKCSQNTLDEIFGEGKYICKNNEQIKSMINGYHAFHLNFVNQDIDVLDYNEPNKKYIYRLENLIDKDNYSVNNINLNPVLVNTHDNIVVKNSKEKMYYSFERNDEFTYNEPNTSIYCIYNLWLKNRKQCFDRTYKKFQDVISDIGGIAQAVTFVTAILNCIFNDYVTISNVEKIIFPYLSLEEITKKSDIKLNLNELHKINNINSETNLNNNLDNNCNTVDSKISPNNNDDACINESFSNKNKNNETQIVSKEDELRAHCYNLLKKKFNFWYYRSYKLPCRKKYRYFKEYEDFRIKIMSEENIIKNHLNICGLLKLNNLRGINRNFCFEELIKE